MPRAEILSKQALHTLGQLHSELAGKLLGNQREAKRLRTAMLQVEAVMKMLDPAANLRIIAPKRRNTGNPWFKRGTLYRSAIDVLRTAREPISPMQIVNALLASKSATGTPKQVKNLEAAVRVALKNHEAEASKPAGTIRRGGNYRANSPTNEKAPSGMAFRTGQKGGRVFLHMDASKGNVSPGRRGTIPNLNRLSGRARTDPARRGTPKATASASPQSWGRFFWACSAPMRAAQRGGRSRINLD
jgi:hypothetical protein